MLVMLPLLVCATGPGSFSGQVGTGTTDGNDAGWAPEILPLAQETSLLRGLSWLHPVPVLSARHAATPNPEAIAWYDRSAQAIYVEDGPSPTGAPRDNVIVHELTHALEDQRFGRSSGSLPADSAFVLAVLKEGSASLTAARYQMKFGQGTRLSVPLVDWEGSRIASFAQKNDPSAPRYGLVYQWGARFVSLLFRFGGADAVDNAFQHPPASEHAISSPSQYFKDVPRTWVASAKGVFDNERLGIAISSSESVIASGPLAIDFGSSAANSPRFGYVFVPSERSGQLAVLREVGAEAEWFADIDGEVEERFAGDFFGPWGLGGQAEFATLEGGDKTTVRVQAFDACDGLGYDVFVEVAPEQYRSHLATLLGATVRHRDRPICGQLAEDKWPELR